MTAEEMAASVIHEEHCRLWWMDAVLLAAAGFMIALLAGGPVALGSWGGLALLLAAALCLVMVGGFRVAVTRERVRVWWGWARIPCLSLPLADVKDARAVTFNVLWRYGGWGIRYSTALGWAFVLRGQGVRLAKKNGGQVTISVGDPEGVARLIDAELQWRLGESQSAV